MQNNHVKNAEELALMRRAAEITDEVYDYVLSLVREGVTEREVADAILEKTLELGASGVSFDTIVAFGAGGAEPHHVPSDKKLEKGMFVTVDMGAEIPEPPTLNAKSEETLAAGQVVTVEPGIYIPNRFGVRIEDMVQVGEGRPFSRHKTELITLR